MGRTPNVPNRFPAVSGNVVSPRSDMVKSEFSGSWWDLLLVRAVVVVLAVVACYYFRPFGLVRIAAAAAGFVFAVLVILAEMRLRSASLRRLLGAAVGALLGTFGAFLMNLVLLRTSIPESTRSFLGVALLLLLGYIGALVGGAKGDTLNLHAMGGLFDTEHTSRAVVKLLDTSVIIDGRVADICETHFLDGVLLVPQFVLRELQLVADSADPLKRQRGRRGLEVLQRIQKMPHLDVQIADEDYPHIAEVDMKLIELAKHANAKIITNDFNLNKVASVQGIDVLNVNQLANALKPVVLPGEAMRVFILREGKEYNQGVAYLDDGTMVVVDGARRLINKTIDILVTSVHQTTAGKMIFGRLDERTEQQARSAAAVTLESNGRRVAAGGETAGRELSGRSADAPHASERAPRPVFPDTGTE
jgi:uncharacterized protein YacL